jgi:hypothetical protein
MRQHTRLETRKQAAALKSMSKEATKVADFVSCLRKSLLDLDRQRGKDGLSNSDIGLLDERRNNLLLTIAALEDRLSAMQGLIDLGRPHVIRVH